MRSYVRDLKFGEIPLHPFLFTLYPIFFIYSKNVHELPTIFVVVRPMIVLSCVTAFILGISYLYFREMDVAAVMASLFSLSSLTLMGGIVKLLMDWLHVGLNVNGAVVYFSAYAVLFLGPICVLMRKKRIPSWVGVYMNVAACIVLIVPLALIIIEMVSVPSAASSNHVSVPASSADAERVARPDVYFIMLDEYGRADVLLEAFQFDNSPFLDAMKDRGFFVAGQSVTSYNQTIQSTAAMLSMDHLENLLGEDYDSMKPSHLRLIQDNSVRSVFQRLGYTTMVLESGFPATAPDSRFDVVVPFKRPWYILSQFELSLAEFTRITRLFYFLGMNFREVYWRQHIEFALDNLDAPVKHDGDKAVFYQAHIFSPHIPYVLLADGTFMKTRFGKLNPLALARQREPFDAVWPRYIGQIQGLNRHIEDAVDRILEGSSVPPIIAIVSDHGTVTDDANWPNRDFGTLFMLYMPGVDLGAFRHDVNDVELFPVILSKAFGFDMPMPLEP